MQVADKLKEMYSLEGKVVVITGAAGGICSEMARTAAQAGATLALCDIKLDSL